MSNSTVSQLLGQAAAWSAGVRQPQRLNFYVTNGELAALMDEIGRYQNTDGKVPPTICGMRIKVVDDREQP